MKRKLLYFVVALLSLAACQPRQEQTKVMARFVPERADDFAWENDIVAFRAYGEALETLPNGALTSPGFDVWVKNVPSLVMDQRYKDDLENGISYHKDHGNGKDCYKVGPTLGGGASSPLINGHLCIPATNFRSHEIIESTPTKVVFVLHYPQWEAEGYKIALDKKISLEAGSHFCTAEDTYTFEGPTETLDIAAGVVRHEIVEQWQAEDRIAIWEKASDTGAEPEESCIGLGVVMPGADKVGACEQLGHSLCVKAVKSGEPLTYYFGNAWEKADIKSASEWFKLVESL